MTAPARRTDLSASHHVAPIPVREGGARAFRGRPSGSRAGEALEPRSRAVRLWLLIWIMVAGALLAYGWPYYTTPLAERAYAPLHDLLKPSGTLGLAYGIAGTACILVGVALYSVRRRSRGLAKLGKLRGWLSLHVFLCSLGPFLILLHTSFKFGGVVAIAFWSMAAVAASGAFGRYVYVHVPRALNGQLLSLQAIEQRRALLLRTIAERSGLDDAAVAALLAAARRPAPRTLVGALVRSLWDDLAAPFRNRRLRRLLLLRGVPPRARSVTVALFREEEALERRVALIRPFQRLFRYWHLLHLPLAILMFAVVALHIGVAVAFGYAWLF